MSFDLADGVTLSVTGSQGIITNTNSGCYLAVNESGTAMITRLINGVSLDVTICEIAALYGVPVERVRQDFDKLHKAMHELGLLEKDTNV